MSDSIPSNPRFTVHDSPYALVGEIERLIAELAKVRADAGLNDVEWQNYTTEIEAERDRLRERVSGQDKQIERNDAMICRLRAALEKVREWMGHTYLAHPVLHTVNEALAGAADLQAITCNSAQDNKQQPVETTVSRAAEREREGTGEVAECRHSASATMEPAPNTAEPFVYSTSFCEKHRNMPWSMTVRSVPYPPRVVCPMCSPPEQV